MKKSIFFLCIIFLFGSHVEIANAQNQRTRDLRELFHLSFDSGLNSTDGIIKSENLPQLVEGITGKAVLFQPGSVLKFPSEGKIDKTQGSMAMWIKPPGQLKGKSSFVLFSEDSTAEPGSNNMIIQYLKDKLFRFGLRNIRDTYVKFNNTVLLEKNEWHYLVITWNIKRGAKMYLDGNTVNINWMPQWEPKFHKYFFLGALNEKGDDAWNAAVDEFTIFNREMTEDEVKNGYLKYRTFLAEVSHKDPFIRVSEPGAANIDIKNSGFKSISLKELNYKLVNNKNETVKAGKLEDISIEGQKYKTEKIPLLFNTPGTYDLLLSYKENGITVKFSSAIYVLEKLAPLKEQPAKMELITTIDCNATKPIAERGNSILVNSPLGTYRQSGKNKHDRFAIGFETESINEPYVAVIEYPDDKPRTMEVLEQNFSNEKDYQANTGVFTGDEYEVTNKIQEHRIMFRPKTKKQAFIFMTGEDNYPAAVKSIKIYKVNQFAVTSKQGEYKGKYLARSTGIYYEDPVIYETLGTSIDMEGFKKGTDRLIEYMRSFGQTELCYPLAWYNGTLYGSNVEPFQPNSNGGAQGGQREFNYPSYILRRFTDLNMQFTAGLHIHTLPSVDKFAIVDTFLINHGQETIVNINKDGKLSYGNWHGSDPNYNPADPRVMQSVAAIVTELCDRYAKEPSFTGISLVMARPSLYTFGSIESGYNDINLKNFQKEKNITIPVYNYTDPNRFAASYKWLIGNPTAKQAWIDWRCAVLSKHYKIMAAKVASYKPGLKLKLNIFIHLANNQRMADYLNEPSLNAMKETGIDPTLYKNDPNIVLDYTLVPADFRWRRSHGVKENVEANRTVMTSPEVVKSMDGIPNMEVTLHDRYFENAIGREEPLEGLKLLGVQEVPWRVSTFNPSIYNSLEPYVLALDFLDVNHIVKGGFVLGTKGMEQPLLGFSQAMQALPAVKFDNVNGVSDPVRVRQKWIDGKLYFYVLNCLPTPLEIKIGLKEIDAVVEPVKGKILPQANFIDLKLQPYDLRVFISTKTKSKQTVQSGDVKVPELWRQNLHQSLQKLEEIAKRNGVDSKTIIPYLALARKCWDTKQYSKLHFLLQEHWAKELENDKATK